MAEINHLESKNHRNTNTQEIFPLSYNIMIIGFMGAGKTTISTYLSRTVPIDRVEMDELIQEKEGMRISRIFDVHGEEYFRNCESTILTTLLERRNLVVSCGGGVVLRDKNIQLLKKCGLVVLLTAKPETIYQRVKDSGERPILNNNMNIEFISELMEKRKERYLSAADIIIETDDKSILEISKELLIRVSNFNSVLGLMELY